MKQNEIKKVVREKYGNIVREEKSCCTPAASCCGSTAVDAISKRIGYGDNELRSVPEGANLGL